MADEPKEKIENKTDENQISMFNVESIYEKEWKDMPEFVQEDLTPKREIIVYFKNETDVQTFAKLMNQKITILTKSLWYPEIDIMSVVNKRYMDEKQIKYREMNAKINPNKGDSKNVNI